MGSATVFYSWQSDLPPNVTRSFIERCLEKACARIGAELACDLVIDQDGRGEGGSPAIPDVIQRKIQTAVAFVADLSIVQKRPGGGGLTNGCVAIEWGWAEQALGSEAMIGVMNGAFGSQSDLPIDIRQNLVRASYTLLPTADDEERKRVRDELTEEVVNGLKCALHGRFYDGIHPESPQLLASVVKASAHGLPTEYFELDQLASEHGLAKDTIEAIAEDLERLGLANLKRSLGRRPQVQFSPKLFVRFDPLYMGWSADRDSITVAQYLVANGSTRLDKYADVVEWPPRRLNPAISRLITNGLVLDSKISAPDQPFIRIQINRNERTRAFAEGRLRVPSALDRIAPAVWG